MGLKSVVAWKRFQQSMQIGYEQWHDGIGYDLDALDDLDDKERRLAEDALVPRAEADWRDLEALDRLGTPRAIEAIRKARLSKNVEIRMYAFTYRPEPTASERDAAIIDSLDKVEPFAGLTVTMRLVRRYPSPKVIEKLLSQVRVRCQNSYHAAETLAVIARVIEDEWDMTHRDLFLRLGSSESDDRQLAVKEFETLVQGRLTG